MRSIAAAALMMLVAVACSTDEAADAPATSTTASSTTTSTTTTAAPTTTTDPPPSTTEAPHGLEADVFVSGSTATFPYTAATAERLSAERPGIAIAVDGPGTGDGAALLCLGEIPIAGADRAYTADELQLCRDNEIDVDELRWAHEAFVLFTPNSNTAVDCLTINQLYGLFSEVGQGMVFTWRDVETIAAGLGDESGRLPDTPVEIIANGEDGGNNEVFAFMNLAVDLMRRGETGLDIDDDELTDGIRPDYVSSSDPEIIVELVVDNPAAIGILRLGDLRLVEPPPDVDLMPVAMTADAECVTPTDETIANGSYPLSRILRSYLDVDWVAGSPAVAAFVDALRTNTDLVADLGLTPIAPPG